MVTQRRWQHTDASELVSSATSTSNPLETTKSSRFVQSVALISGNSSPFEESSLEFQKSNLSSSSTPTRVIPAVTRFSKKSLKRVSRLYKLVRVNNARRTVGKGNYTCKRERVDSGRSRKSRFRKWPIKYRWDIFLDR